MASQSLATECFRLNEFSGLLQLAFGLNLALSIFRELAIVPRGRLARQIAAIETLIGSRKVRNPSSAGSLRARLESAKREIVINDDSLATWVTCCAAVTSLFGLAALYWSFYAAVDQSCMGEQLALFTTIVHFVPLPLAILILYARAHFVYKDVWQKINLLKQDALA
ncbi:hypothetical protein EOB36_10810 [Mesorhizobium sp. M6A.T.Cr.TU.017.01.1.1]|uniref:hypothetical protein n=1 Tax=Mesorhizobium sp. M6A.T.Cr.TU.017.01.1.1 TaxID=2496774 RepID=UPI000FD5E2E8|nr:hypothetical protein [Mesorhizobium sp. M6A.T.Cr.TU.017.01.1.1]RUV02132.1 hypothetical protein EOB36_10810 [Mesorhizobium sp. M6A.T.Cr.TU.017.01.1.1]